MPQTGDRSAATPGELYELLIQSWNHRDARAFALCFTSDGSIVGFDGSQVDGQSAIGNHVSDVFSHHQTAAYVTIVREVRSLTADVALLRANAGMVPPGKDDINPDTNAAQSLIAVRTDRDWKAALFQNTPSALHGRPQDVEKLTAELRAAMKGA